MAKERFEERNEVLKEYFDTLAKKQPNWRADALIEDTAKKFFISPRTVTAIIKEQGAYAPKTNTEKPNT